MAETQTLFAGMQETFHRALDADNFVGSIKNYDGTSIDIHNQMDVDEFYNLLFDRWEAQLMGAGEKQTLRRFYGGQLVQQIKSQECEHISERLETFSAIQCEIKGISCLKESLQAYVDGELMDGDNKYKCSTCDRHVDAIKRACLKDLPDNLIFHLKRFDFNLRTLQRNKINEHFSFPERIDMAPYTVEHLSGSAQEAEDVFELVGVLVHTGTAEAGHYYSYIRERAGGVATKKWVEFNDDVVSNWDPSLMESCTFGGPAQPIQHFNNVPLEKPYSAYMLFYQRATSLKMEQNRAALKQGSASPPKVEISRVLKRCISDENRLILTRHCLFDEHHTHFVQQCFEMARQFCTLSSTKSFVSQQAEMSQDSRLDLERLAMRVAVNHLDQIVSRTKSTPLFEPFRHMIEQSWTNSPSMAVRFYDLLSDRWASLRFMVQRNPEPMVRSGVAQLIISALTKISDEMPQRFYGNRVVEGSSNSLDGDEDDDRPVDEPVDQPGDIGTSIMDGMMLMINFLWSGFPISLRSWDEVFGMIRDFAKISDRTTAALLQNDFFRNILFMVLALADDQVDLSPLYARMVTNIQRRATGRLPSYEAVLQLLEYLLYKLEPRILPEVIVDNATERSSVVEAPFPWTSDELNAVHMGNSHQVSSLFVEKLIMIDQAPKSTERILIRLIHLSDAMEKAVVQTLRKAMIRSASVVLMDPYLRAAKVFLQHSENARLIHELLRLIRHYAANFKPFNALEFLDIFSMALNLTEVEEKCANADAVYEAAMGTLMGWVPVMITSEDENVRNITEQLLQTHLVDFESTNEGVISRRPALVRIGREVAGSILHYVNEQYIATNTQISSGAARSVIALAGNCVTYCAVFENDSANQWNLGDDSEEEEEPFSLRLALDGM